MQIILKEHGLFPSQRQWQRPISLWNTLASNLRAVGILNDLDIDFHAARRMLRDCSNCWEFARVLCHLARNADQIEAIACYSEIRTLRSELRQFCNPRTHSNLADTRTLSVASTEKPL